MASEIGGTASDSSLAAMDSPACCSAFYEQDWVRQLAEDSFHPGGTGLTDRTIAAMTMSQGAALLDLGCGTGTTALRLASQHDLQVSAVDISTANIERASKRMDACGVAIDFRQADAHHLPFDDEELDGVLAECAFSLFNEKSLALAEIQRVLKPGGKLAITDMAIGGALPDDISSVLAPWTCLADALNPQAYVRMFLEAGFKVEVSADESTGLTSLLRRLKRRLLLVGTGAMLVNQGIPGLELSRVRFWLDRFQAEVDNGTILYYRFNLQKPL